MPTPTTAAAVPSCSTRSSRIPPSLWPSARTSLGHFRSTSTPVTRRTAAAAAIPVSSGSHGHRSAGDVAGHQQERDRQRGARRRDPLAAQPPAPGGLVLGDQDEPLLLPAAEALGDVGVGRGGLLHHLHAPASRCRAGCSQVNRWAAVLVISSWPLDWRRNAQVARSSGPGGVDDVSAASGRGHRGPRGHRHPHHRGQAGRPRPAHRRGGPRRLGQGRREAARQGQVDRPGAHRAPLRRGFLRRARRAGPAPFGGVRPGEEPAVRRRRDHRLRHHRRPPGVRVLPGLHRLRRLAGRGVRREDHAR